LILVVPNATGLENSMARSFITAVGAVSIAAALGSASFVIGCRVAGSGSLPGANGIGTGLLFSIAIAVWGIFALLLWGMPGKG
jgi:hypothetical protein